MNPQDERTLELARRTRKNREYIYAAKEKGENVEEFTQLLNSMLGMMVSLREEYFRGRNVTWDDVAEQGLLVSESLRNRANHFSQLISKLRHAFAHNNFELIGNP